MSHVHTYRVTPLTPGEAEQIKNPAMPGGYPVFFCIFPKCGEILTGSEAADKKRLRR